MIDITYDQLAAILPKPNHQFISMYIEWLNKYMNLYEINTYQRATAFLAQIMHESGGLRYVEELASGAAYEGRMDLGNVFKGDGVKFKGRGLIQITGRANYARLDDHFGLNGLLSLSPDVLESPKYAVKSACWYWNSRKISDIADKPENWTKLYMSKARTKFEWITILINGGLNNYTDRLAYYRLAQKSLKQ